MYIIDRRLNPKGKSLANRQRFFRRAKQQIRDAVRDAAGGRKIADIADGENITIPSDGLREPTFHKSARGGRRDHVLPGNKEFVEGDRLLRPPKGGSGQGSQASPDGEGQDAFRFVLSRKEFVDIFLEDLELPDLLKKSNRQTESTTPVRAGYSVSGSPSNLNVRRTMRNSLSRRIALKRPKPDLIHELEEEIARLVALGGNEERVAQLRQEVEDLLRRSRLIPFIDPVDVRYSRFDQVPKPITQAVMFCLMDVSGSMTEEMKDLAKRFFMLLYLFIQRRYKHVDIVFIRHTSFAQEVDEDTFFYSTETGGTIVSTALTEMQKVVKARYPSSEWNIYAAQASDGDNLPSDNPRLLALLESEVLPLCQYFAYVEVGGSPIGFSDRETGLWRTYRSLARPEYPFAMRRVNNRNEIYPVFRDLFSRDRAKAQKAV